MCIFYKNLKETNVKNLVMNNQVLNYLCLFINNSHSVHFLIMLKTKNIAVI